MIIEHEEANFEIFRDCLSTAVIDRLAPAAERKKKRVKGRKNEIKPVANLAPTGGDDAAELSDFVEYLAEEIFLALPEELRTISFAAVQNDAGLAAKYAVPLDPAVLEAVVKPLPLSVSDSLTAYDVIRDPSDLDRFVDPALSAYITSSAAAPPEHTPSLSASRSYGCEICLREHLPLTYHHLIPRQVHAKAVKRGWASEWELQKVAWLCRACHSFVHRVASNEELGREFNSVDALLDREDVQRFAQWVGRVRWKAR